MTHDAASRDHVPALAPLRVKRATPMPTADAGEAHYMTGLGCDTLVPPDKGFSVFVDVEFDHWQCNALSCN